MTDAERDRVVRELRRIGRRGDPAYRAAKWIEDNFTRSRRGAGTVGPDAVQASGAVEITETAEMARRVLEREPPRPPPDHAVRDMLAKETISMIRQEREHGMAMQDVKDDYEYIEYFRNIAGLEWVADMIAMTARLAGELPHDLLHPSARSRIQQRLEGGQYADRNARQREVQNELSQLPGGITWTTLVDPGLVAIANMACHDAAKLMPRLRGLRMDHVNTYARQQDTYAREFMSFFCGVLASTWRFNSVMAAQPYKTKNEHAAVLLALHNANSRLTDYCICNDVLVYKQRDPPPTNLSQLIALGTFAR
jgi:hypothetical protein